MHEILSTVRKLQKGINDSKSIISKTNNPQVKERLRKEVDTMRKAIEILKQDAEVFLDQLQPFDRQVLKMYYYQVASWEKVIIDAGLNASVSATRKFYKNLCDRYDMAR